MSYCQLKDKDCKACRGKCCQFHNTGYRIKNLKHCPADVEKLLKRRSETFMRHGKQKSLF